MCESVCVCTYGRKKLKEGGGGGDGALAHAGLHCFSLAQPHSEVSREANGFGVGKWVRQGKSFSASPALCRTHAGQIYVNMYMYVYVNICIYVKNACKGHPPSLCGEQIPRCVIWTLVYIMSTHMCTPTHKCARKGI